MISSKLYNTPLRYMPWVYEISHCGPILYVVHLKTIETVFASSQRSRRTNGRGQEWVTDRSLHFFIHINTCISQA